MRFIISQPPRGLAAALALVMGMALLAAFMIGVALAQEPQPAEPPPGITLQTTTSQTYYLILNTARPLEETLPPLLARLAALKDDRVIQDFSEQPERSAPNAVPGIRVVANVPAERLLRLRLPGVLDVQTQLPPPPPPAPEIGALAVTGIVTGRVYDASTGAPVAYGSDSKVAAVEVYDAISFAYLGCVEYNSNVWCAESADANGVYSITVTAPYTKVKVFARPWWWWATPYYAEEWYNNRLFFSQADPLVLTQDAVVSNVNFAMDRAGTINGIVQLESGFRLKDVDIDLFDAYGNEIAWDNTDTGGRLLISGLRAGAYRAYLYNGPWPGIVPEWYQDRTSLANATPITVNAGLTTTITATVSFTDEAIAVDGNVIFRVNDAVTGEPLSGVRVLAYPVSQPQEVYDCETSFWWDRGSCDMWLDVGDYYIRFVRMGYETEYYNDRPTLASADILHVTSARINVLAALAPATARITGTVTYQGNPLTTTQRVWVIPYISYTQGWWDSLCDPPYYGGDLHCPVITGTGVTTPYSIPLSAGDYKIHFYAEEDTGMWWSLADEWYNDKPFEDAADIISLASGSIKSNINADLGQLGYYGCITGVVRYGSTGVHAIVTLYPDTEDWDDARTIYTDPDGTYGDCGVPPEDYLVSFSRFPSATTWYKNATSSAPSTAEATRVTITSGYTTPNINGYLGELGACISGKFVDTGGQPASWASFWLYDAGNTTPIGFWNGLYDAEWTVDWWGYDLIGEADADGGFVACGLSPGTYRFEAGSWQEGKGSALGSSAAVTVGAGEHKDIGVVTLNVSTIYLPIVRKE
jgi:hypothetical protein